jgi:hypothetical protein
LGEGVGCKLKLLVISAFDSPMEWSFDYQPPHDRETSFFKLDDPGNAYPFNQPFSFTTYHSIESHMHDSLNDFSKRTPQQFSLSQNYPNLFNTSTTFSIEIPERSAIELCIYNLMGQLVCILYSCKIEAGFHNFSWNGSDDNGQIVGSGMYFVRMVWANENVATKKLVLMK